MALDGKPRARTTLRRSGMVQSPAMRIAISTPNVMVVLRRSDRARARPYNFAMSPVLVNLSGSRRTLLAPFETNSALWGSMLFIDIHDGSVHQLNEPTVAGFPQTFDIIFSQYCRHPEAKSLAPNLGLCEGGSQGLLKVYPVMASGFQLIGKETERGWEQAEDVSTILPSLVRYGAHCSIANEPLRERLVRVPLKMLQYETGLSRHTIIRARHGKRVHPRSLRVLALRFK